MTQASFLPPIYLLDSSCPIRLDGRDRVFPGRALQPPAFSPLQRGLIWQGLENLCSQGRLALIRQVADELKRLHPDALLRLRSFRGHRVVRMSNELRLRYQQLLSKHADLAEALARMDPSFDPADPWLIVCAQKHGYAVVTEEVPMRERSTRPRHGPPIPDLCEREGIPWANLIQLANDEGWFNP